MKQIRLFFLVAVTIFIFTFAATGQDAAMVEYLRMNGITPPASRGRSN